MNERGATLFELLVACAVLALVLCVAVPGFSSLVRGNALATSVNRFLTGLQYARSEAMKRGTPVTLRRAGATWASGWTIFADANHDGTRGAGEAVLRQGQGLRAAYTLTGNRQVADFVSYVPSGQTRKPSGALQMGTLTLCDDTATLDPGHARAVVISATGRARVSRDPDDIRKNSC